MDTITTQAAFGKMLRNARLKREISLTDLARQMGVSIQFICDVEGGRKALPPKHLDDWAIALGEDPDLMAVAIASIWLDSFNRQRKKTDERRIVFRVVPVFEEQEKTA